MGNEKYLNEESYQRSKKKIARLAILVLVIGFLIGGGLIAIGITKQSQVESKYSTESRESLEEKLEVERQNLVRTKKELEEKIEPTKEEIKRLRREPFTGFDSAYYEREDEIEKLEKSILDDQSSITLIGQTLDENFSYCSFGEAKNHSYTKTYCSLKNELNSITDFNLRFDSSRSIPYYMFGAFIIVATCMVAGSIYLFTKRREMLAFTAQQVMPVAKEITKGIKDGLKDDEK